MKLHSDIVTDIDVMTAAREARVTFDRFGRHGSRKRARSFDVTLRGESRRRPNAGTRGAGDDYAATWDQWGVFLGHLFRVDPDLVTTYYVGADAFSSRTHGRFDDPGFPADYHGDHVFRFQGVPREQSCTKCSAVQTW